MSVARKARSGSAKEFTTAGVVTFVSGVFSGVLTMSAQSLQTAAETGGAGVALALVLNIVAGSFIGIALFVAAIVTTNAVATVVAGRVRPIALLRLIGADASTLRVSVLQQATAVSAIGAVLGVVVGTLIAILLRIQYVNDGTLPDVEYPIFVPMSLVAVVVIILTTTIATWVGTRSILTVSPAQASASSQMPPESSDRVRRARMVIGAAFFVIGIVGMGLTRPMLSSTNLSLAFAMAFGLGALSFIGLMMSAEFWMPKIVRLISLAFQRDPSGRIAARNAVQNPQRTTRATIGLVIGVALVTMFTAGGETVRQSMLASDLSETDRLIATQIIDFMITLTVGLVAVSALIAAIGFVSTMSLAVIQRNRELGLTRALGFTGGQVRKMIGIESFSLAVAAVVFGLVLGSYYGVIAATNLIVGEGTSFQVGLPWLTIAIAGIGALALVLVSSQIPATRALRPAIVEVLRTE